MKILISHVFSDDNKGDAALLSVLIKDVRTAFSSPEITVLTMDKIKEGHIFEDAIVENSFMYHIYSRHKNQLLKLGYALFSMTLTLIWAYIYKFTSKNIPLPKHLAKITAFYRQADLIIPVGGGYVRGKPGFMSIINVVMILHPMVIGYVLNKPTILAPQSVGPFSNKLEKILVKYVLKRLDLVILREDTSFRLLKNMGVTHNVIRAIDSGFAFSTDKKIDLRKNLNIPNGRLMVGMTVRKWLKPESQIVYQKAIATFADYLIENYNAVVIFIPQVTAEHHKDDDRVTSQEVYELLKQKEYAYPLMERYDHSTIKAIYSSLDYMIGTRFHSVIFSLTSYVPAIAIEYEHKTSGIMHDLNLDEWVIKIEDVTAERLETLFAKLVKDRAAYHKHLTEVLPLYIQQTEETPRLIREAYERRL